MIETLNYYVHTLRGKVSIKMRTYENREKGGSYQCERLYIIFLTEFTVHKLLTIITKLYARKRKQAA